MYEVDDVAKKDEPLVMIDVKETDSTTSTQIPDNIATAHDIGTGTVIIINSGGFIYWCLLI